MVLSANCGEIWMASVRLPKQGHPLCHPISNKPIRYTIRIEANQAMATTANFCSWLKAQVAATANSTTAATIIKCLKDTCNNGSASANIAALPKALIILASPVIVKIAAALKRKQSLTIALC